MVSASVSYLDHVFWQTSVDTSLEKKESITLLLSGGSESPGSPLGLH